ncbi:MmcQ/YjbR family DNA-binding protein [candidate division CSSED10-310 bacterium]|uniref:MmcQ/YjbR family DNA-binding protein n=1 Tax=candidate division CSSED10-310 bacterium TaxID=2855610 RepID=A0ABV6YR79_UNCC1
MEASNIMDLEAFRQFCSQKKGVMECFPFDFETLVMKVGSKMFALTAINVRPLRINLKCDPFIAEELRAEFAAVQPGYHMNKRHWNTVTVDGSIPKEKILWMIDHSYDLVFKGLKKSEREEIRGKKT